MTIELNSSQQIELTVMFGTKILECQKSIEALNKTKNFTADEKKWLLGTYEETINEMSDLLKLLQPI